jgi:succinate-semialdehyde dehydrogenase/glutarate-semialdehyde dehydrogenase
MTALLNNHTGPSTTDVMLEVLNPASGEVIAEVPEFTRDQFDVTLAASRRGARAWAATPAHERVAVLRRFAAKLEEDADRIARIVTRENGKVLAQARTEVEGSARIFRGYAEEALRQYGTVIPGDSQPGLESDLIMVHHEPYGVLGAILPFNFPVDLFSHKVAPALATGNAVIVKPAENAPLAVIETARLLHEAGVPPEALQIVTGSGSSVGSWLAESPDIDIVSFTGSTDVGIRVAQSAARNLNPTFLELGGNDPMLVLPDADLDEVVAHVMQSRMPCNGQTCCATKRLLVHRDVAADLTNMLAARFAAMVMGDPATDGTELGPLIDERAANQAAAHVATAIRQGARLVSGDGQAQGNWFAPVLLGGVTRDADIARDTEVFAPVLPIIEFSNHDEAVSIANQSRYGLNASVFTRDIGLGLQIARRLESGTIAINGGTFYRPDAAPFGGFKHSGLGREGLATTLREFTQPKTVSIRSLF